MATINVSTSPPISASGAVASLGSGVSALGAQAAKTSAEVTPRASWRKNLRRIKRLTIVKSHLLSIFKGTLKCLDAHMVRIEASNGAERIDVSSDTVVYQLRSAL